MQSVDHSVTSTVYIMELWVWNQDRHWSSLQFLHERVYNTFPSPPWCWINSLRWLKKKNKTALPCNQVVYLLSASVERDVYISCAWIYAYYINIHTLKAASPFLINTYMFWQALQNKQVVCYELIVLSKSEELKEFRLNLHSAKLSIIVIGTYCNETCQGWKERFVTVSGQMQEGRGQKYF